MLTWKCLPLLLPILLCGCAHNFDRNAIGEPKGNQRPERVTRIIIEGNDIVSDRTALTKPSPRPGEGANGIKAMARRPEFDVYGSLKELKRVMARGQPGCGITELGLSACPCAEANECCDTECEILGYAVRLPIPSRAPKLKPQVWEDRP